MSKRIERIIHSNKIYAINTSKVNQFKKTGVDFVTNKKNFFQLGFIKYKKNHKIQAHYHTNNIRKIYYCSEVLLIQKGKLKVKFYDIKNNNIKKDRMLYSGDIIMLFRGGRGFDIIVNVKIIEIKQGPYFGSKDKIFI